jgi:hypothetical protein
MYVHRSRIIVFILVILGAGLVLVSACSNSPKVPTPTPTTSPLDLVKVFEDAFNQHDITGLMALLTEDVVLRRPYDGDSYRGKNFVQGFIEVFAGSNGEAHFTDCANSAELVTCKLAVVEDCTRSFGMDAYHWDASFKIVGDKISEIIWDNDTDDFIQYVESVDKAVAWFEESHPEEYKQWQQYMQLVNYGHSIEKGNLLSKICKEYAASIK